MSSEGNSERNLDSGFIFVCPQVILLWAWEMNSTSFALVIATYISLLSSSKSFGSSMAFASGKTESSAPTIKTTGNSSPLLEWTVMSFTASAFSSLFSMVSTIKVTSSKNRLKSLPLLDWHYSLKIHICSPYWSADRRSHIFPQPLDHFLLPWSDSSYNPFFWG